MMRWLPSILDKEERLVIGLMSGTSADGIDAALVRLRRRPGGGVTAEGGVAPDLLAFETTLFPEALRRRLLEIAVPEHGRVDAVCRMHFVLGELFARAAVKVARTAGVSMEAIDLIGSHGQTIHHLPERVESYGVTTGATLQIGDPSVIAQRTGVTTVGDFRPADVACGGQGAPLVPYADYLVFRSETRALGLLNIGGIANVTVLPAGAAPEDVTAFDTGPGNMVIDAVTQALTGRPYDHDGRLAGTGRPCAALVETMQAHPYFTLAPPKSTGRETFGGDFCVRLLRQGRSQGLSTPDLIATATEITIRSIHRSYKQFIEETTPLDEVIVSGGGARNARLLERLAASFDPVPVVTSDARGMPSEAKEAIAFAILAHETISGRPGNLPGATGANRRVVLGKICVP